MAAASSQASTQVRSSPQSSSWSPIRRVKSDSWKNDWKADAETLSAAPRWSMGGKSGLHTPEKVTKVTANVQWDTGGRSRDTWVQAHARKSFTPGPGKYRTDMDLPMQQMQGTDWVFKTDPEQSDTVNIGNSRRERTAKWTFIKDATERNPQDKAIKLSPLKPSYMQVRQRNGTSSEVEPTPGPGHYVTPTSFGAASGGHRSHFFPSHAFPSSGKNTAIATSPGKRGSVGSLEAT